MLISITTTTDDKEVLASIWQDGISVTLRLTPSDAIALIGSIHNELNVIERCAKIAAIRAKAEQLIADEEAEL